MGIVDVAEGGLDTDPPEGGRQPAVGIDPHTVLLGPEAEGEQNGQEPLVDVVEVGVGHGLCCAVSVVRDGRWPGGAIGNAARTVPAPTVPGRVDAEIGEHAEQLFEATRPWRRAAAAPMQWWGPFPNVSMRRNCRVTSRSSAVGPNSRGSRLAEP